MNAQLEQQIQADFPFMKLNKIDGEENLYRRWGCDCDDGWYNLIHDMCQAITDRYAEEGLPIDLIPTQLKEKFATLRFYYSFEGAQYGSAARILRLSEGILAGGELCVKPATKKEWQRELPIENKINKTGD